MGWEAGFPAGFDERTTGFPKGIKSTCTRQGGEVQCRHPEGAPALPASKAVKMGALSVSCALSSLGGGKCNGRGAEGVSPSHRQQGNGQHCKGFGAETIPYWAAGEAAEEGEGD